MVTVHERKRIDRTTTAAYVSRLILGVITVSEQIICLFFLLRALFFSGAQVTEMSPWRTHVIHANTTPDHPRHPLPALQKGSVHAVYHDSRQAAETVAARTRGNSM